MRIKSKKVRTSAQSIRLATAKVKDTGKVRLGGISPSVGPVRIATTSVSDSGKVRLGGISPSV